MLVLPACRGCLTVNGTLEKLGAATVKFYSQLTGLEIKDVDGFPQQFCLECRVQIKKALAFRRKCKRAHYVLKEIGIKKQIKLDDIVKLDRKKANLESSLNVSSTFIIADIKPDSEENSTDWKCDNGTLNTNDEPIANETSDNKSNNFNNNNDNTENVVDMEDIFKDLTEERAESENESEVKDYEMNKPKLNNDEKTDKNKNYYKVARMFCDFSVRVLDMNEQIEVFRSLQTRNPYSSALIKCSMCLSVFRTKQELIEHAKNYIKNNGPHLCKVCQTRFKELEDLNKHIADIHLYEYTCKLCSKIHYNLRGAMSHICDRFADNSPQAMWDMIKERFSLTELSESDIREKTSVVTTEYPYYCYMCYLAYKNKTRLEMHSKSHVNKITRMCEICGGEIALDLEQHMDKCHKYSYECNFCHRTFFNFYIARHHMKKCQEPKEQNVLCPICGKIYSPKGIQKHMYLKHKISTRQEYKHHCARCGLPFKEDITYYRHQVKEHSYVMLNDTSCSDSTIYCQHCRVQFTNEKAYKVHVVSAEHEEAKNIEHACIACKKLFDSPETLSSHECTKFPVTCEHCYKMLNNMKEYVKHYFYVHSVSSSFMAICDLCGESVWNKLIKKHVQKCQSLKSRANLTHVCQYCNVPQKNSTAYVVHVVYNHTHLPYVCAICGTRTANRMKLKDHICHAHELFELHICTICNKRFKESKYYQRHMLNVHHKKAKIQKSKIKRGFAKNCIKVYPHAKIDVSLVSEEYLRDLEVKLLNYDNTIEGKVDNYEIFLYRNSAEQIPIFVKKKNKKMRKTTDENVVADKNISENNDENPKYYRKYSFNEQEQNSKRGFNFDVDIHADKATRSEEHIQGTSVYCKIELQYPSNYDVAKNEILKYSSTREYINNYMREDQNEFVNVNSIEKNDDALVCTNGGEVISLNSNEIEFENNENCTESMNVIDDESRVHRENCGDESRVDSDDYGDESPDCIEMMDVSNSINYINDDTGNEQSNKNEITLTENMLVCDEDGTKYIAINGSFYLLQEDDSKATEVDVS